MPDTDPAPLAAPARWAAAGFIGGASLVGMLWTILGRAPSVIPPAPPAIVQPSDPATRWTPRTEPTSELTPAPTPTPSPARTPGPVAESPAKTPEPVHPEPHGATPGPPDTPDISAAEPPPSPAAQPDRLNINTASAPELELLPRIGPTLAGRIIEYRETKGPIRSLTQLMEVRGIGVRTVEQLEPYIRFD